MTCLPVSCLSIFLPLNCLPLKIFHESVKTKIFIILVSYSCLSLCSGAKVPSARYDQGALTPPGLQFFWPSDISKLYRATTILKIYNCLNVKKNDLPTINSPQITHRQTTFRQRQLTDNYSDRQQTGNFFKGKKGNSQGRQPKRQYQVK